MVGALLGFYFEDEEAIKRLILEAYEEEEMAFYILLLSCVCHGDLSYVETLRPFMSNKLKSVRLGAAEVAIYKNMPVLAWSRVFQEKERDVRDRLLEHLLTPSLED